MSSKLKIITDIDCQIYCDYEYVGDAISGSIFHLNLRKGIYLLEFKKDTKVLATRRYKMESNDEEDLLEMSLLEAYNDVQRHTHRENINNLSVVWLYTGTNWRIESVKEEVLNTTTNETWIDLPSNYALLPMGQHPGLDIDCLGNIPFNIGGTLYFEEADGYSIEGGMWGCINKIGEVTFPPIYRSKVFFWNDLVTVIKEFDVIKGIINYDGEQVFEEFGRVRPINEQLGLYETIKGEKHGVIDKYGKYIIKPCYAELEYTGENCIWAKDIQTNCWGLLNTISKVVLPFVYDAINKVGDGYYVCSKEKWGCVNNDGIIVENTRYTIVSKFFVEDYFTHLEYAIVKNNDKYGIVNTHFERSWHGTIIIKEVIPCIYDAIFSLVGNRYNDNELAELSSSQLGLSYGHFQCYFVINKENQLHCTQYYQMDPDSPFIGDTFICDTFNKQFFCRSNKYYFMFDKKEAYDLITSIDFYNGTFNYEAIYPVDWDHYSSVNPIDYVKQKCKRAFKLAKKEDRWFVLSDIPNYKALFSCKCNEIVEFGFLVTGEYFAIVEFDKSKYIYVIDDTGIVFESEAMTEIHSSYHYLRDLEVTFDDKYNVNGISNDYFIAKQVLTNKYIVLKWWSYGGKMLYSQDYDNVRVVDEQYAEVEFNFNGRTLYNTIFTVVDDNLQVDGGRWKLSPYNERDADYMAEFDFSSEKEGLVLYSRNNNDVFITEQFIWDYARVFVGNPWLIKAVGNIVNGKIKCALKDVNHGFITEPIFSGISVGDNKNIVEVYLGEKYRANVDLNNKDINLYYALPFLDYKYSSRGDGSCYDYKEHKGNPFKNIRLYIDTETTGLPIDYTEHYTKLENWPYVVQIALIIEDDNYGVLAKRDIMVKPDIYTIPDSASKIHGITNKKAEFGEKREEVFIFMDLVLSKSDVIIGHNASFDLNIIKAEIVRTKGLENVLFDKKEHTIVDTMRMGKDVCKIPGNVMYGGYKYPKLDELYYKLFNVHFENQHTAMADVEATYECYKELLKISKIK